MTVGVMRHEGLADRAPEDGRKSVPVKLILTVTVLSRTSFPTPPRASKHCATRAGRVSGP